MPYANWSTLMLSKHPGAILYCTNPIMLYYNATTVNAGKKNTQRKDVANITGAEK